MSIHKFRSDWRNITMWNLYVSVGVCGLAAIIIYFLGRLLQIGRRLSERKLAEVSVARQLYELEQALLAAKRSVWELTGDSSSLFLQAGRKLAAVLTGFHWQLQSCQQGSVVFFLIGDSACGEGMREKYYPALSVDGRFGAVSDQGRWVEITPAGFIPDYPKNRPPFTATQLVGIMLTKFALHFNKAHELLLIEQQRDAAFALGPGGPSIPY